MRSKLEKAKELNKVLQNKVVVRYKIINRITEASLKIINLVSMSM